MDTLVLFLVTTVAWFSLELWRVLHRQDSISTQIEKLNAAWPTLGFLAGLISGLLLGHWFFR